MTFQNRYSNLNPAQKQAVDTIEGPVMVVAGPGTGKTELLSVRAANILQKTDTLPENILCLTFTESGAVAMRERLVGIIGKDAYKVAIHTFHSFGSEIIAQNREYFYRGALFEPADDLKQYAVLRNIFESLDHKNPLAGTMNSEFTHMNDAKRIISELKRTSALTSDELLAVIEQSGGSLDAAEKLLKPIFEERVGKTTGAKLAAVAGELKSYADTVEPIYEVTPLIHVITESLQAMLLDTETVHPTKPITAWKAHWMERNDQKQLVFKSRKRLAKLHSLAYIYGEYLRQMEAQNLFDYDDMIMQVVHAIEVHDDLRFNLQERYLYLMIDEFQDTNLAQLRILHGLTDNPVNEGAPNILVVGDDDQAVYGFQGADISNILNFSDTYPSRQLVVLTDNYRSEAPVLTTSRAVITQVADRLESRIPELSKQLTAHRSGDATVMLWQAPSVDVERSNIVRRIVRSIKEGADPSSIAVLARRHADIQSLLPYFKNAGVAVRYEREESVLDSPPVMALEQVSRVLVALADGKHDVTAELLPELLAHPAWKVAPKDLWQLSLTAYETQQHWLSVMATTPRFVPIYEWLVGRAAEVPVTALEPMIDSIIGKPEDEETPVSPFFEYYFSTDALAAKPEAYLECLGALRAIRSRLREHQPDEALDLRAFLAFVDLHRRLEIGITTNRYSLASDVAAVQLLTAHKSKGLEFDTVYVFNSVDNVWGQTARTVSRSISYPENLPLAPAGNTADERIRLFYVAMTRAKSELIMTFSDASDVDKQTLRADFLVDIDVPLTVSEDSTMELAVKNAELAWYVPYSEPTTELKTLLAPRLEQFKISATSLNAFLDVSRGGPQEFLLNNLLHFPKAKGPAAAYGTAIHRTMQQAHTHLSATGEHKPLEDMLHDFEEALTGQRLSPADHAVYLQKGSEAIPLFMSSNMLPMHPRQKAEVGFGHQNVHVGDAHLTGSIDLLEADDEARTICVTDYKTGTPSESWTKGQDYTKLKLHKYRQQLLFYKLLVEESSTYGKYVVDTGQLAFVEPTRAGESIVLDLDLTAEDVERTRALIQAVWTHIVNLDLPDTSGYSEDLKGVLAFEQDLIDGVV